MLLSATVLFSLSLQMPFGFIQKQQSNNIKKPTFCDGAETQATGEHRLYVHDTLSGLHLIKIGTFKWNPFFVPI